MLPKNKILIIDTLLTLMETDDFHLITVSEICACANIARRTFYNYFESKEGVLQEKCRQILLESSSFGCVDENEHSLVFWENFLTHFFKTIKKYKDYFFLLLRQNLFLIYIKMVKEVILSSEVHRIVEDNPDFSPVMKKFYLSAYCAIAFNLCETWGSTGFEETPEEMAKILINIVLYREDFALAPKLPQPLAPIHGQESAKEMDGMLAIPEPDFSI